jgi:hypothetical protein
MATKNRGNSIRKKLGHRGYQEAELGFDKYCIQGQQQQGRSGK